MKSQSWQNQEEIWRKKPRRHGQNKQVSRKKKKQVQAKAQRLRRYAKRANFFRQNKTFRDNAKQ